MSSWGKTLALILTVISLSCLVALQPTIVKANFMGTNHTYTLPAENATIILPSTSNYEKSVRYASHNTTEGFVPESWDFTSFSTGNGTVDLTISAQNCNVTINSYNYLEKNASGKYEFYVDTWLNYSLIGTGNQTLDFNTLYNTYVPARNPIVYIDGIAKQQGDGWDWANFGIIITGASSTVSINQESTQYLPPRNAPHLETIDYLLPISVILAVIIAVSVLLYRRHRKTTNLKQ